MCKYFPNLRELKIDENRLSEISDRGFEDCGEITILTMRKNKLTEIKSNAVSSLQSITSSSKRNSSSVQWTS